MDLGRLMSLVSYNAETGVLRWVAHRGGRAPEGSIAGTAKGNGYVRVVVDGKSYAAHRLAWLYVTGAWPSGDIDHINGDRADNRWSNLREATRSQNLANSRPRRSETGMKGVTHDAARRGRKKFMAKITKDGRPIYLGRFETAAEASHAYAEAATRLYGAYARIS